MKNAHQSPKRTVLLDGDVAAPQQARLGAALAQRGWRVLVLAGPAVVAQMAKEFRQTGELLRDFPT